MQSSLLKICIKSSLDEYVTEVPCMMYLDIIRIFKHHREQKFALSSPHLHTLQLQFTAFLRKLFIASLDERTSGALLPIKMFSAT